MLLSSSSSSTKGKGGCDVPWNERYRPRELSDVCGQTGIVDLFTSILEQHDQPMHLLFYGPPGTGKTSTILSFCREIYPPDKLTSCVLNINASYDCDIDMVRSKIKTFCKQSMSPFEHNGQRITYKFIVLDEADTLTLDAQNALRRCIEVYSYSTRFCFLCNYISNLIAPILSRCYIHHFRRLSEDAACGRLRLVAEREGVELGDETVLSRLYAECRGDLRKCITSLETLRYMNGPRLTADMVPSQMPPAAYWDALPTDVSLTVAAEQSRMRGVPCRELIRSFIVWACDRLTDEQLYRLGPIFSRMEKQLLLAQSTLPYHYTLLFWHRQFL